MKSIEFYNHNHLDYIKRTYPLDMSESYKRFLQHVQPGHHILDLGCGCGRDSEYFLKMGYQVTALDGSKALIDHCRTYLKTTLVHDYFETFQSSIQFDGIWASASLLHVPRSTLKTIVDKYLNLLKPGGVFYMSFKNFDEDFHEKGRDFTCFNPDQFRQFLLSLDKAAILSIQESKSIQTDNMRWVSAVIKKL